jgi:hypothetical protein
VALRLAGRTPEAHGPWLGVANAPAYEPPSFAPGETELARVARFSTVVADTLVPEAVRALAAVGVATAAVVFDRSQLQTFHVAGSITR